MNRREVVIKNTRFEAVHTDKNYRWIVIDRESGNPFINISEEQVELVTMFINRPVDIVVSEVYHKSNGRERILYWDLTHIKVHEDANA
jgi:hypothetical protein